MKKLICAFFAILMLTGVVSAKAVTDLKVPESFEVYKNGDSADKVSDIVGMDDDEFTNYCKENSIVYFAVTKDNKNQIKIAVNETPFSASISNLTLLKDSRINSLMPDIIGNGNIKGEIVEKDGQKFVRTFVTTSDSGGGYTVEQFLTVANKKQYVLSLLAAGEESRYESSIFESFASADFLKKETENKGQNVVIIISIILISAVSCYLIFTIIRDLKRR